MSSFAWLLAGYAAAYAAVIAVIAVRKLREAGQRIDAILAEIDPDGSDGGRAGQQRGETP